MRKWIGTAGSPGTGSKKIFQTSGNKYLFKYINIYNRVYQRYTGPEKERKQRETGIKHGWGEFKKEECRHRGLLKQKRITEAECKGKEQKWKCKKMGNAEMTYERREWMKKNMQNTDIKEKNPCIQLNPWRSVESYGELK